MNATRSLSTKLSLFILALTSVVFILTIGAAAISSHILITDEATKSLENLRDATIKDMEKTLQNIEFAVEASSWLVNENKDKEEYLYHITDRIVSENENIVGSAIAFCPGYFREEHWFAPFSYVDESSAQVKSKQLGSEDYDYFDMEWYKIPAETGQPHWSEPYFDEGGGGYLMCTYSFPVYDENYGLYAVMTADITLKFIEDVLESIKPYEHSVVSLMTRNGNYLKTRTNVEKYGTSIFATLDSTSRAKNYNVNAVVEAIMSGKKGHMQYAADGHLCFAVYGPLSNGWLATIATDYKDVHERSSIMRNLLSIIGIFGLIIMFLISFFTIRKMTKPLTQISEAAEGIAGGNFNMALPEIDTDDEVRQLRDSFEMMQNSLQEYIDDLKTTTAANERFESELSIASKIQMSMLPKEFPNHDGIDLHAILKPAREVGGDLYDFFVRDNCLYFVIGDVSGKSVPAALIMSIARCAFRICSHYEQEPKYIVTGMNRSLCSRNDAQMFVTFFLGKLDLGTGLLKYCNAGHNPIIVNGRYLDVKPNLALGLISDFTYEQQEVQLDGGACITLYTDGITEAEREDKQQFGEEALLKCTAETGGLSAEKSNELIIDKLLAFTKGNVQNDDITIMTIKINK